MPSRKIHAFEKCVKSLRRSHRKKGHSYTTTFINSFCPPIPCPPVLKLCMLLFPAFPESLSTYRGCFTVCQFCFVAGFLFQRSFHGPWSFHGTDGSWICELLPRLGFSTLILCWKVLTVQLLLMHGSPTTALIEHCTLHTAMQLFSLRFKCLFTLLAEMLLNKFKPYHF